MNWIYKINLKEIWSKYSDVSHEDFDNDPDLFQTMKKETIENLVKQMRPGDYNEAETVINSLRKAKHLSSFNAHWNRLYDFLDYKKIWLSTEF